MKQARERYLMVVVDAPALVPAPDAAIVASKTDATVLVVAGGRTTYAAMRKALARLRLVGVEDLLLTVFNFSTTKPDGYAASFANATAAATPTKG